MKFGKVLKAQRKSRTSEVEKMNEKMKQVGLCCCGNESVCVTPFYGCCGGCGV